MTTEPTPPDRQYITLAHARALECNGCGDCCDSRRTDGYWTWGTLPPDQFASLNDGTPLIIPLERIPSSEIPATSDDAPTAASGWRDRAPNQKDELELSPTRFRCTAFLPQEDGRGLCGHHDRQRPDRCGEFPVRMPHIEQELTDHGEVALNTSAFPNCTWYRVTLVPEDDPRSVRPPPAIHGRPTPPARVTFEAHDRDQNRSNLSP
jgi:hypothetical protein